MSVVLLAVAAESCVWFWQRPSTGTAIAVLGAVAVVISMREIGPREKLAWLVVVFALLSVELRSINKDNAEKANAWNQETTAFQNLNNLMVFDLDQVQTLTRTTRFRFEISKIRPPDSSGRVDLAFVVHNDVVVNPISSGAGNIYVHICDNCRFYDEGGWTNLSGPAGKDRVASFDHINAGMHTADYHLHLIVPQSGVNYQIGFSYDCEHCDAFFTLPEHRITFSFPPYVKQISP